MANTNLTDSLNSNIKTFKKIFKDDKTIIFRNLQNQHNTNFKCCLVFSDGMVDGALITRSIIDPLLYSPMDYENEETQGQNSTSSQNNPNQKSNSQQKKQDNENNNSRKGSGNQDSSDTQGTEVLSYLQKQVLTNYQIKSESDLDKVISSIEYGFTALLIDGSSDVLLISTIGWEKRSVEEPASEPVVRGPREGFTESLSVNISLIKKRLLDPALKFEFKEVGTYTHTKLCLAYIEGVASPKVLEEVEKRLEKIEIDGITDSGYIQELIKDQPLSPFKTIGNTERPDVVVARLLEGRIIIICDGSPFALTLPYLFLEYFQASEDYYEDFLFASFNRILRYIAFFLTSSIPAIYVALVTYNQELIPTSLLLTITSAREGVPFPTIVEAYGMLIVFEILREAGVRLPKPIGQAVSIVGTLVLGDAAVNAKFISAPMIIVVALTGISSFLIPKMPGPLLILRYALLGVSAFIGLEGYLFGVIAISIHLITIRSFGVPYMANIASVNKQDSQDVFVRVPLWKMKFRPQLMSRNKVRSGNNK